MRMHLHLAQWLVKWLPTNMCVTVGFSLRQTFRQRPDCWCRIDHVTNKRSTQHLLCIRQSFLYASYGTKPFKCLRISLYCRRPLFCCSKNNFNQSFIKDFFEPVPDLVHISCSKHFRARQMQSHIFLTYSPVQMIRKTLRCAQEEILRRAYGHKQLYWLPNWSLPRHGKTFTAMPPYKSFFIPAREKEGSVPKCG